MYLQLLKMGTLSPETKVGDDIPNSPSKCLLKNWKQTGEDPRSKLRVIQYFNQWWPEYKLNYRAKWPENGTLVCKTLLQQMLFHRREGKWNELPYVDLFFYLENHLELQKECLVLG